jgi:DNA-binding SARP family transcriptional activator
VIWLALRIDPWARNRASQPLDMVSPRLTLLEGFALRCQGATLPVPSTAQRLLAFLGLRDRPASRSQVAGTLWPEVTEERAASSLRSALWRLPHASLVVRTGNCKLRLGDDVTVDYREAWLFAQAILEEHGDPIPPEQDEACLTRELLPGWWDDWLVMERERFRQLRLHALEARCQQLARDERFSQAIQVGLAVVACEPLRESGHRALISIHLAEGNRAEAVRHYDKFRRLLADELGLSPSSQFEALLERIRAR